MPVTPRHTWKILWGILGLGLWGGVGCGTAERLAEGEVLYTGAELKLEQPERIAEQAKVTYELSELIEPSPNGSILGLRPNLWVYQTFGQKKPDGLGGKIRDQFGNPPVLLDTARARRNTLLMEKYLQDQGYFHSEVSYTVVPAADGAEADVHYRVQTSGRYHLSEVIFPPESDPARRLIRAAQPSSLLQPGDPYQLSNLQGERARLTDLLRQEGYANFFASYLYYTLDTLSGDRQVRLRLWVQDPSDSTRHHPYYLRRVLVYPDYSLDRFTPSVGRPPRSQDGLTLMQDSSALRLSVLRNNILLDPGKRYSERKHRYTLQHLQDLGTYKFVNIKYRPEPLPTTDSLAAVVYLTPLKMKEVGYDLELDNRTGLFSGYGTSLSGNFTHRNLFRGAERFNSRLSGSLVLQPDSSNLVNTLDLGLQLNLFVPRFLLPFAVNNASRFYLPQTRLSANYSYQQRVSFYTLGRLGASFGYQWRETREKQHELTPLSLLSIDLLSSSSSFDSLLETNPFLRGSFSNVLVLGPQYRYTFQQQPRGVRTWYHYFQGGVELSGNLLWLGYQAFSGRTPSEAAPYRLLGRPFAQYARLELDYRAFFPLTRNQKLAFRFLGGVGVPYGNAQVLPYLKQFFTGGPVSLRAFGLRQVGPGSFRPRGDTGSGGDELTFVDQTGALLLEGSAEYRFPIYSYLKGAAFVDAGNVWLLPGNEGTGQPGREQRRIDEGTFALDSALSELAIGAGVGLRLDVDFFVLRVDVATPLRNPGFSPGQRWTFSRMRWLDPDWLLDRNNLRLNVAIGYPF